MRIRLTYSLRTLLVVLTGLGIGLSVWVRRAERQRTAVTAIRATFSDVYYDLNELDDGTFRRELRAGSIPRWLIDRMGIDYFQTVVFVVLDAPPVSDDTLEHLRDLPHLRKVAIIESGTVTGQGLARLKHNRGLKSVSLCLDNMDDVGMAHLGELRALEELSIWGEHGSATDDGLEHLRGLKHLKHCYIDLPQISDAGRERLQEALPDCKVD